MKKADKILWEGVEENDLRKVALALNLGADVSRTYYGKFPLHYAKSVAIVKLLIEAGADVNAKDNDGDSPLHWVRNTDVAELLISAGADVNAKNNYGNSVLHVAAEGYKIDLAKLLILAGADVNAKNKWGRSPLDFTYSEETEALLKQHGATS